MNTTKRIRVSDLAEGTCRRCSATKPSSEMTFDRGVPTRLCKACNAETCRIRYEANAEMRREIERARRAAAKRADPEAVSKAERYRYWEKKKRDPIAYILARFKRQAKVKGVPFALSREDIFIPEYCPVLGIRLTEVGAGRGDNSPEVDRPIPSAGYVPGNIAVISARANRLKDNGSALEHERIAAWMRSKGAP